MTFTVRLPTVSGRWAFSLALIAACAACKPFEIVALENDYITYRHAFTDAAAADVRKNADQLCGQKKRVPVRTTGTCSLNNCTTTYQCMNKAEAESYR